MMNDKPLNFFDTFGMATVKRVCTIIGPALKAYGQSKALAVVKLSQHYRGFTEKEKVCMLNVLHIAFGGTHRSLISELNIRTEDKSTYIERAKAGNF